MLMVPSTHGFLSALVVGWDPAHIVGDVILSNSNRTATANFNSGQTGARGFGRNSGKRYFEITFGGNGAFNQYLGICNGSFAVGGAPNDANAIGVSPNGQGSYGEYHNNVLVQDISVAYLGTAGDVVMVAADLTGGQVFLGINGIWANTIGPGGPVDWTVSGATTLYPVAGLNAASTAYGGAILNTGDTPFTYALPSSYSAWG